MTQTKSIQEHLTAVREEIQSASKQRDEEAKTRIDSAIEHAKQAATDLRARRERADAKAAEHYGETLEHLDRVVQDGTKAMSGAAVGAPFAETGDGRGDSNRAARWAPSFAS